MWYIKGIENNFLKSFPKMVSESRILEDDPANSYPAVMVVVIVGVAAFFAIFIWWLERKTRRREDG